MLETIREYGLECLTASGEEHAIRRAHADCYLALVEAAEPALTGPEQTTWLERLETEHDNLRAALRWAEEGGEAEIGLRLAGALCQFWLMRGHLREGQEWLARLLGIGKGHPHIQRRAKALTRAGHLADNLSDYAAAHAFFAESLAIRRELGEKGSIAAALNDLGWVASHRNDFTTARTLSEEGLALWRELGDKAGIAPRCTIWGGWRIIRASMLRRMPWARRVWALRRELGDKRGVAFELGGMGRTAHRQGDYRRATALLRRLAMCQDMGVKQLFAWTSSHLAEVAYDQNGDERATALLEESLTLFQDIGHQYGPALTLGVLRTVAHEQGDRKRAIALYEEARGLWTAIGFKWGMATTLQRLGTVAHAQGDDGRATALYEESLALRRELGNKHGLAECLEGLAGVAVAQRAPGTRRTASGRCNGHARATGAPVAPRACQYDRDVSTVQAGLDEATFAEAWAMGKAMPPEQIITYGS